MKKLMMLIALSLCCTSVLAGCGKKVSEDTEVDYIEQSNSDEEVADTESVDEVADVPTTESEEVEEVEEEEAVPWGKGTEAGGDYNDAIYWDNDVVKTCFVGYVKDFYSEDVSEVDEQITLAYRVELPDELPIPSCVDWYMPNEKGKFSGYDIDCIIHTLDTGRTFTLDEYDDVEATDDAIKTLKEMNDGHTYVDATITLPSYLFEQNDIDPEKVYLALRFPTEDVSDDIISKYSWITEDAFTSWSSWETDFMLTVPNTSWEDIYKPTCVDLAPKEYDAGCFIDVNDVTYYILNRSSDSDYYQYVYERVGIYVVDKDFEDMHTQVDTQAFEGMHDEGTLFVGDKRWLLNSKDVCPYYPWEDFLGGRIDVSGTITPEFAFVDEETLGKGHRLKFGYNIVDGALAWTHNMGSSTDMCNCMGLTFENPDGTHVYLY